MQAFFSSEGSYALQFLVIFLVILVLFLIAALLFMRLSGRGLTLSAGAGQRGRQPRLGIVDIYELDRQRQLILLRRDNVEHLLLVGGPNDVVIERHIQRGAGTRYAPDGSVRPGGEAGLGDPALEPRTDPFLDSPMPPTFAMPEVVPSAGPGAQPAADRAPPLDPGLFEPEVAAADAPARPVSPVSRLMRRTPPVVSPRPEVASERPTRSEPAPTEPVPDPAPEPPVMASRGPRSVDPAVLSDMARQLQVALKRPSSAVTPPPAGPAQTPAPAQPPTPAPKLAEPAPAPPDPIAAAMAASPAPAAPPPQASPVRPEPAPTPATAAPPPEPKPAAPAKPTVPAKPTAPEKPVAPPPFVAPPKPEAARSEPRQAEPPGPEPVKPETRRPEPSKAEPSETAAGGQNPFSVEEIEAEFARLLGRPLDSKN